MNIDLKELKQNIKSKGVKSKMARKEKREFTEEEKKEFVANNSLLKVWVSKEKMKEFDTIIKEKEMTRTEAIGKILEKFVAKNKS